MKKLVFLIFLISLTFIVNAKTVHYNLTSFYTFDVKQTGKTINVELSFNDGYHDYRPEGVLTLTLHWHGTGVDKTSTVTINVARKNYEYMIYATAMLGVKVPDAFIGACWLDVEGEFLQTGDTESVLGTTQVMNLGL